MTEKVCPFCRTPYPLSVEETIERITKRMEVNDAEAIHNAGNIGIKMGDMVFHKIMARHYNYSVRQQSLVAQKHIVVLPILITMVEV